MYMKSVNQSASEIDGASYGFLIACHQRNHFFQSRIPLIYWTRILAFSPIHWRTPIRCKMCSIFLGFKARFWTHIPNMNGALQRHQKSSTIKSAKTLITPSPNAMMLNLSSRLSNVSPIRQNIQILHCCADETIDLILVTVAQTQNPFQSFLTKWQRCEIQSRHLI